MITRTRPLTHPFWAARTLEGGLLRCVAGPAAGQSWTTSDPSLRIGSDEANDVVLPPGSCAAWHALLRTDADGVVLQAGPGQSLGLCGGEVREAWLSPHTEFQVGRCSLLFESTEVRRVLEGLGSETSAGLCARSDAMRELLDALGRVAPTTLPVLISGETGVGKERVAAALHTLSPRAAARRVVFDCGSVQPQLAADALFGHVGGAYSGAIRDHAGVFESASGGSLQLDNVDELPLSVQPLLLRAVEERSVLPLGSNERRPTDVRLIATTRHDLRQRVADGRFREDLYFRLSVVELVVPSLRARSEDLPLLVEELLSELGSSARPSMELHAGLALWSWPGNVRELRNVLERAVALKTGPDLGLDDLPAALSEGLGSLDAPLSTLPWRTVRRWLVDAFERRRLVTLLEQCDGNAAEVARVAGLAHETVLRMLKRHGLSRGSQATPR